ncbi:hypothetical protein DRF65_25710 [Chryseobacterium pennae]|uniref:Uncharacterized protein n=1 Tax=Chryseobacterium pennae TaxID=2258962 RepID=A0A3D9C1Z0_9FLAO|nr:hypothetical protein DRF65_25710 [Chryseobacterium pennae]
MISSLTVSGQASGYWKAIFAANQDACAAAALVALMVSNSLRPDVYELDNSSKSSCEQYFHLVLSKNFHLQIQHRVLKAISFPIL